MYPSNRGTGDLDGHFAVEQRARWAAVLGLTSTELLSGAATVLDAGGCT